ncbi:hypothetical protein DUNSADRAFT_15881 [Dunaliella salina]|uniref:Encoded protein n=1 Tax=Dunaliella salina TaxID=3046 RepID=A0ABQ7G4Q7_DUNSA|nr:hypothetical protein DUNSADRAFT_15881 [Dunaliella salina]|eukprot:KAF5829582.1 hypothetical protein DUNSADRAFT_15881 [Dunaliella salina]
MPITINHPPEDTSGSHVPSADLSCYLSAHCGFLDNVEMPDPATSPSSASAVTKAGLPPSPGSNTSIPPPSRRSPIAPPSESVAGQQASPIISVPAAPLTSARASFVDAASSSHQRHRQYRLGGGTPGAACAGDPLTEGTVLPNLGTRLQGYKEKEASSQNLGTTPVVAGAARAQEVQGPHHQLHQLHSLPTESCVLSPPHSRRLFSLPEEQEGLVAS